MRKIRSNAKKMSVKTIVLIILFVFFLTISVGYSYLKQSLNMTGKSTIVQQSSSEDFEQGNSTYTWEIVNSWGGGTASYIYQIKITIVNMDEDISIWELSFGIPDSYDDANSNSWSASERIYENGRLTLVAQSWNGYIAKGDSLSIEFQLAFSEEEDADSLITNVALNGFLMTEETVTDETVTDETVTDETVTDETVTDETVTDETVTDETVTDETVTDETVTDETVTDETVTDETVTDETVTDETVTEETVTDETMTEETATDETITDETVTEETVTDETVSDESVTD